MGIKRVLQLSLVILLLLSSVFFYQKFFKLETNLAERKINEEDSDIKKEIDKSNLIQSLRYVSQDLVGNTYIINAESAKFEKDETDNIFLFIVNAEIIRKDNEVIKIYSDTANVWLSVSVVT